jgi:predicted site-specific integrase-resolvase
MNKDADREKIMELPTQTAISQLISRKVAAQRMDVSMATIKRYGARGLLNPIKIGPKIVRYKTEEIQNFIDQKN